MEHTFIEVYYEISIAPKLPHTTPRRLALPATKMKTTSQKLADNTEDITT